MVQTDNLSIGNKHMQPNNKTFGETFSIEISNASLSKISSGSLSDTLFSTKGIINKYDRQIANYRHKRNMEFHENKMECDTHHYDMQFASWEAHTKCFASKMFKKMGYGGKGLGKNGEGITQPVNVERKSKFHPSNIAEQNTIP